jgi:hypothetical protein
MQEVWKTLVFIGLLLLGLLGLAMTVCGGGFLMMMAGPEPIVVAVALFSLVIGLFILYLAWRGIMRVDK